MELIAQLYAGCLGLTCSDVCRIVLARQTPSLFDGVLRKEIFTKMDIKYKNPING